MLTNSMVKNRDNDMLSEQFFIVFYSYVYLKPPDDDPLSKDRNASRHAHLY